MERRYFNEAELRAAKDSRTIEGYAALYNKRSENLGGYTELIEAGAFDNILNDDVRALFNHDPSKVLARTKAGTLTLEVDEKGLKYRFDAPETTTGNDLLIDVRNGNVDQSSFGFTVDKEEWLEERNGDKYIYTRMIKKVKRLYDVSPVTFPAYSQTSVKVRSIDELRAEHPEWESNKKEEPEIPTQNGNEARLKYIETLQKSIAL